MYFVLVWILLFAPGSLLASWEVPASKRAVPQAHALAIASMLLVDPSPCFGRRATADVLMTAHMVVEASKFDQPTGQVSAVDDDGANRCLECAEESFDASVLPWASYFHDLEFHTENAQDRAHQHRLEGAIVVDANRLTTKTEPLGRVTTYTHNAIGQVLTELITGPESTPRQTTFVYADSDPSRYGIPVQVGTGF